MSQKWRVNLASEPFRRDRPLVVASAGAVVLLSALLAVLVSVAMIDRQGAADTRDDVSRLQMQLRTLDSEQARLEAALRKPGNEVVVDRARFLNALLQRKGISWTKIFADLEGVVPYNVRLISVRPQVTPQNDVVLDMVVGSQTAPPVLEMLMKLEGSPLFGQTALHSWLPPSQTDPLYKYRVSVYYAHKL